MMTSLIINGQAAPSSTNATFDVLNPATRAIVGKAAAASSQDCLAAIESAAAAFVAWEATPLGERQAIVRKAADLLETEKYQSILLERTIKETGAPAAFIKGSNAAAPAFLRSNAESAKVLEVEERYPSDRAPGASVVEQRRAMGVVLAISPWNAPFYLSLRAIVMPILCGNTCVLKCSEYTPSTQSLSVELLMEAGLPPGVLNFVAMKREDAPRLTAEMIAHPAVRKINFTGSERVGRIIASEAGKNLKPCVLELGGKSPALVLDDADVDAAARALTMGAFLHGGQICMSVSRVAAQRGIYEPLLKRMQELSRTFKAGDSLQDPDANVSVLFTEESAQNVVELMKQAKEEGAEVVVGHLTREGNVVQPHLLTGVSKESKIWRNETFGPDLIVNVFDTLEEGIAMTNDSDHTLSSCLWTLDIDLAMKVAPQIHSGYVNINNSTIHAELRMGLIGLGGSSGYGRFSVDDFVDKRIIVVHPIKN